MPAPYALRDYALLADGERGALVGPRGDIVWLCAPGWSSPPVFSSLIGGRGFYAVTPADRFVWGGSYEPGSLVWRSRWVTDSGVVECREALAFPGTPGRLVLLRRVRALDAPARLLVRMRPRGDYDRAQLADLRHDRGCWQGRIGGLTLRWTCGPGARTHGDELRLPLRLAAGESHDLVLELGEGGLDDEPVDPAEAWRATEAAWAAEVPDVDGVLAPEHVRQSYAVLRGLTASGGGTVAAATTSLPERSEAGRNYDYRYVWIRDQCYVGQAAAALGGSPLLDGSVRFVAARLAADGDTLVPAYTTAGEPVPPARRIGLPGYPGGYDVVGNRVARQFQLDAFGEALLLFAAAARTGRLDDGAVRAGVIAADVVGRRWNEPDSGMWELEPRAWTHSRLTASAGLRAFAAAVPRAGPAGDWTRLADAIVADTTRHALHPSGHWQRSADDPGLDGALLLPGLRGAVAPDDRRTECTFAAYLETLVREGFAYRFRHDERPLPEAEGSFLLCGFLVALTHARRGERAEALAWFERTRAACSATGLFSEEYDVGQRQLRGNLPQAFVQALMIEAAARLAREDAGPGPSDGGTTGYRTGHG